MMKLLSSFLLISALMLAFPALALESKYGMDGYQINAIDAAKNARNHSNLGNIYFAEKNFPAALSEYKIAYNLVPKGQIGAVYLYNIARCYKTLGLKKEAKKAIEGSIRQDCMNLSYYDFLAQIIVELGLENEELKKYSHDKINPYNSLIIALIYLKLGQKQSAITLFDDFINRYPSMIITEDVQFLLNRLQKENG